MKKNILLVEDNSEVRVAISERLSLEGFHVITADSGSKAIELSEGSLPDLIVCQAKMKDMDGYQVFMSLFSRLFKNSIPFIYFTRIYHYREKENIEILSLENFLDNRSYDPDLMVYVKNCLPAVS